jgi:hypothetical protein
MTIPVNIFNQEISIFDPVNTSEYCMTFMKKDQRIVAQTPRDFGKDGAEFG